MLVVRFPVLPFRTFSCPADHVQDWRRHFFFLKRELKCFKQGGHHLSPFYSSQEAVTKGGRRFMAAWREEEEDAARHRQEKREATRLGKLQLHTEA